MTQPPLPSPFLTVPLAHRALHGAGAPENSRAAVRAALRAGFGIEIDLQLSSDGVAMVFHDGGLSRLTAELGPVRERSAAALGAIPLAGTDEGIPRFDEILGLVGGAVPVLVELKDQTGDLGESGGELEAAAAHAARRYDGPLAFMSFNPSMVRNIADAAPGTARGLVTSAFDPADWPGVGEERLARLARIERADELGVSFVSHAWQDLGSSRVAELKRDGRAILCWTIRNEGEEALARRVAHNITFEGYQPAPVP